MEAKEGQISKDKTVRVEQVLKKVKEIEDWHRDQRQGRGEASPVEVKWKFARQVLELALNNEPSPVINDGNTNIIFDLGEE